MIKYYGEYERGVQLMLLGFFQANFSQAKKLLKRGFLMAMFSVAVTGCSTIPVTLEKNNDNAQKDDPPPPKVTFFEGGEFDRIPGADNGYIDRWNAAEERQKTLLKNRKNTALFNDFLKTIDSVKKESLSKKAIAVNKIVNDKVTYTPDETQYKKEDYWACAIETLKSHKGDCEDYAILKYEMLRALGVPENRLYFTLVNSKGSVFDHLNHAVLMVNVADKGEEFVILQNGDDNSEISKNRVAFFIALNKKGFYQPALQFENDDPAIGRKIWSKEEKKQLLDQLLKAVHPPLMPLLRSSAP